MLMGFHVLLNWLAAKCFMFTQIFVVWERGITACDHDGITRKLQLRAAPPPSRFLCKPEANWKLCAKYLCNLMLPDKTWLFYAGYFLFRRKYKLTCSLLNLIAVLEHRVSKCFRFYVNGQVRPHAALLTTWETCCLFFACGFNGMWILNPTIVMVGTIP